MAGSVGNYNVTLTNFKADMAALAAAGYATVTPAQYVAWLDGINLRLPAKPVLITFDDAFWSDTFATPILAQYGFHAVMFVVTGYADELYGTEYAPWKLFLPWLARAGIFSFMPGSAGMLTCPIRRPHAWLV